MIHVSVAGFAMVMEVLGLVFGVLGAFVIFFVFMSRKNEKRFTGRLARMYDFLNYRGCFEILLCTGGLPVYGNRAVYVAFRSGADPGACIAGRRKPGSAHSF